MDVETLKELSFLVRKLLYDISKERGWVLHEFAGCPPSNFHFSRYGLKRGCVLCRINQIIAEVTGNDADYEKADKDY